MKSRLKFLLAFVGVALILVACQSAPGSRNQNLSIIMGEGEVIAEVDGQDVLTGEFHRWEPNVLVVHKGDQVSLTVSNPRKNIHSLFLSGYNLDTGPLAAREGTATLEFTADQAGVFQFFCNIPPDTAEGECDPDHATMVGYLIVLEN